MTTDANTIIESQRIEKVYAQRSKSVPRDYYSPLFLSNLLSEQELERRILKSMAAYASMNLGHKRILEIGCGEGYWLRQFIQWGAKPEYLAGVDLLPDRVAKAREVCHPGIHLECREASHLDFADGSFDIVLQLTVFSSILDAGMKNAVAREMLRVLRPDGSVLWYDFFVNNPRNPDVRGIGKQEMRRLFPDCRIRCERITVAPPLGRVLGRMSRLAYEMVSALRFADTHYLALIQKNEL